MATREQLQEFVCGHGCVLDLKRGMGTNGPCRHMQYPRHLSDEDRRIWRGLVEATRVHRRRAEELEAAQALEVERHKERERAEKAEAELQLEKEGTALWKEDMERCLHEAEAENARLREEELELERLGDRMCDPNVGGLWDARREWRKHLSAKRGTHG